VKTKPVAPLPWNKGKLTEQAREAVQGWIMRHALYLGRQRGALPFRHTASYGT
jgi:hypothetical protein